ncbi:MAG: hypothetical protein CMP65_04860 [Flavobacteriales bacterium]|nr:hypothetical protein [Flavobacteriales bacterium]|tara:strand:- start:1199 stop:2179 length:981 start_codon:yes stop_codon:yes gene_type:complete
MRLYFLIFTIHFSYVLLSQIGGVNTNSYLNLNTSPRIISLGGYVNVLDDDLNVGVFNPSLINSSMLGQVSTNFTNYYSDIFYGDFSYCFNFLKNNIITNIKYVDYGSFVLTDEFSNELGAYSAAEYVLTCGFNKELNSNIYLGVNGKIAYSSMYLYNSLSVLLDFGFSYTFNEKDMIASLLVRNIGHQIDTYQSDSYESLPFELIIGISNKLAHVPIRWYLNLQHLESPILSYDYVIENNFFSEILRHVVFGTEFLIHDNFNLFVGYNNRKRSEMIIQDRRELVGFSYGIVFKIKRFSFFYSRSIAQISGGISTFGITTNFNKIVQ